MTATEAMGWHDWSWRRKERDDTKEEVKHGRGKR